MRRGRKVPWTPRTPAENGIGPPFVLVLIPGRRLAISSCLELELEVNLRRFGQSPNPPAMLLSQELLRGLADNRA